MYEDYTEKHVIPEIYEDVKRSTGGICNMPGCLNGMADLMHGNPKSEGNKKKYPLFIHSPFNLYPGCKQCHIEKPSYFALPDRMLQVREDFLESIAMNAEHFKKIIGRKPVKFQNWKEFLK